VNQNCDFCERLAEPSIQRASWDFAVLTESDNFVLVAAAAPITTGHVLLIPRNHVESFAAIDASYGDEIRLMINCVESTLATGESLIISEHGSTGESAYQSCINHGHLHMVGTQERVDLHGGWTMYTSDFPLDDPDLASASYLFINLRDRGCFTRAATANDRRFVQRLLAPGHDDAYWDWPVSPRPDTVLTTVRQWSQVGSRCNIAQVHGNT